MRPKELPEVSLLREYFSYDPLTGEVKLIKGTSKRTQAGYICGSLSDQGYLKVHFKGESYQLHRIIWKIHTGKEPLSNIDHIDGNRTNNIFSNLSSVDHTQNAGHRLNSLGYSKRRKKFVPKVTYKGETRELKYCSCQTSARVLYLQEKIRLGIPVERLINENHLLNQLQALEEV